VISTLKLVGSLEEQRILEELIERQKPALPKPLQRPRLHYLLFTPFRYPPLPHGSRFGTREEPGIWYGADSLRAVFAEKAYYRFLFLAGTRAHLTPITVEQTAFTANVDSARGVDLTLAPFDQYEARISSKTRYTVSQLLGQEMRRDGVEVFRYRSARDVEHGTNVAIFTPKAFAYQKPGAYQTWICLAAAKKIEFAQKNVSDPARLSFSFSRSEFEVDGSLPAPAV
jgi:RES domain